MFLQNCYTTFINSVLNPDKNGFHCFLSKSISNIPSDNVILRTFCVRELIKIEFTRLNKTLHTDNSPPSSKLKLILCKNQVKVVKGCKNGKILLKWTQNNLFIN